MELTALTPERRNELLAHDQRAEFYSYLKATYDDAVAERYLQTCDRTKLPHRGRGVKGIFYREEG